MTSSHPERSRQAAFWRVEPVHDAVVSARLEDLQATMTSRTDDAIGADSSEVDHAIASHSGGVVRSVRHRVGRAVTTVGRAIEGSPDCVDPASHGMA